jgi:flagellar biosynthetic protein FlhB
MARDDKTEKATPKRRGDARKRGQVAKSTDLNGAVILLVGLFALSALAPAVVSGAADAMRSIFAQISHPAPVTSGAGMHMLVQIVLRTMLIAVAPIAGACVCVAVLVNLAQVGWKPSLKAMQPNFKRLNPASGFRNLFGPRMFFEGAKSLVKVAIVALVAAMALVPQLTSLGASVGTPPAVLGHLMSSSVMGLAERIAIAYVLIGLVDLVYQRRRHGKMLRMTKQEIKDEFKQTDLPPEVKGALRRRQLAAARARMMAAVPTADVVVTNPTHFAVALRYDGTQPAPVVVAKGQDLVALQIRRIAEEHKVPIVPDAPLARSLYTSVELGQMIPIELYAAVAQVLAFVYRMAGRRKAMA